MRDHGRAARPLYQLVVIPWIEERGGDIVKVRNVARDQDEAVDDVMTCGPSLRAR